MTLTINKKVYRDVFASIGPCEVYRSIKLTFLSFSAIAMHGCCQQSLGPSPAKHPQHIRNFVQRPRGKPFVRRDETKSLTRVVLPWTGYGIADEGAQDRNGRKIGAKTRIRSAQGRMIHIPERVRTSSMRFFPFVSVFFFLSPAPSKVTCFHYN